MSETPVPRADHVADLPKALAFVPYGYDGWQAACSGCGWAYAVLKIRSSHRPRYCVMCGAIAVYYAAESADG